MKYRTHRKSQMLKKLLMCSALFLGLTAQAAAVLEEPFLTIEEAGLTQEFEELQPELAEHIGVRIEKIDLNAMYPYYTGANYFDPTIQSSDDFLALIERQEYYQWILPLEARGQTIEVSIARQRPVRKGVERILTTEKIQNMQAKVGKWDFNSAKHGGTQTNWKETALALCPDADQIVLVNGPENTYTVFAVCIKDGTFNDVVAVNDGGISLCEKDAAAVQAAGLRVSPYNEIVFQIGDRFAYSTLQQTLGQLKTTRNFAFFGNGGSFCLTEHIHHAALWVLLPVGTLVVGAAVGTWWRRTRSNKK